LSGRSAVSDKNRPVFGTPGKCPMAAAYQTRIKRNHIKKGSESEFLLQKSQQDTTPRPEKIAIKEKFAGIKPRFAMNVNGASKIGS
jgi:hypothetical protein